MPALFARLGQRAALVAVDTCKVACAAVVVRVLESRSVQPRTTRNPCPWSNLEQMLACTSMFVGIGARANNPPHGRLFAVIESTAPKEIFAGSCLRQMDAPLSGWP
jgi:hypothetical protein